MIKKVTDKGVVKDSDGSGFYGFVRYSDGKRVETLRVKTRERAHLLLYRGMCHGFRDHLESCGQCKHMTDEVFK